MNQFNQSIIFFLFVGFYYLMRILLYYAYLISVYTLLNNLLRKQDLTKSFLGNSKNNSNMSFIYFYFIFLLIIEVKANDLSPLFRFFVNSFITEQQLSTVFALSKGRTCSQYVQTSESIRKCKNWPQLSFIYSFFNFYLFLSFLSMTITLCIFFAQYLSFRVYLFNNFLRKLHPAECFLTHSKNISDMCFIFYLKPRLSQMCFLPSFHLLFLSFTALLKLNCN